MFQSVAYQVRALEALLEDEDLKVVRVNYTQSLEHDSFFTGGFQCISVSVCLITLQAHKMCASGHMCEVELVLKEMRQKKNPQKQKCNEQFQLLHNFANNKSASSLHSFSDWFQWCHQTTRCVWC